MERKEAIPFGNSVNRPAGESPARLELKPGRPEVSLAA